MKLLPTGEANFYRLMDGERWIAVIQLNGELMPARQRQIGEMIASAHLQAELLAECELFIARTEAGEIRSVKTYASLKRLVDRIKETVK